MTVAGFALHLVSFIAGNFIPDSALTGLKLTPVTHNLLLTVALRSAAYALLLICCIGALKLPFGRRPTLAGLARPLPGAMVGIAGSWFWAVSTQVQYGVRVTSRQKQVLRSIGGMALASELPLLIAYLWAKRAGRRRAEAQGVPATEASAR